MKTILLFFLLASSVFSAQMVKGTVVDDTGHRIDNVNIYLDGTKTGTISKEDGSFTLNLSTQKYGNLVFQKEDYETFTIGLPDVINKTLKVVLTKTNAIEEIRLVPYTPEAYQNYINYFLDTFIGNNREDVKIKNQRSLKFSYDKKNKLLKVKAPNTLIIENKNLGYEISYNLISFSADFNSKMVNYTGTSFFKESKNTDKVKLNRMNAYEGSLLHFFRSIYDHKIVEAGFIVNQVVRIPNPKYPSEEELNTLKNYLELVNKPDFNTIPENIREIASRKNAQSQYMLAIVKTKIPDLDYVKRSDGQVFLEFKDILQVNYLKYYYELKGKEFVKRANRNILSSFLHSDGESFEVSKEGNITTPDQLINEGDFSKNKIENMLPLDYQLGD
ncbi:carboxypeptidase-like regulatory domain-containing protein [Chryseobacterium viscerum]|uniref:Carboxypeptidase-like regulatory domain-containing protein n=1 Tax=Chryseobacterium viscerum TaxID=1037377 RepID=A0A5N4BP20_9FLAO|nr:carboxypeptidase-like regulatory domain-containing protein [Chryseobacterium viscerum]KAB1229855.1 carboxypeptidase-like regulatory domain-containing protein [Chryseobacterium viscerum]